MHIHLTAADFHPDIVASREIGLLVHLVSAGDVEGLRGIIDSFETIEPGHWEKTAGRLHLRISTTKAIEHGSLSIVQYLCEERGVPPLAEDPEAYGACLPSAPPSFMPFPYRFNFLSSPHNVIIHFHSIMTAFSSISLLFSYLSPSQPPPYLSALAERRNMFREIKRGMDPQWIPLKVAVVLGRTEIGLYLLGSVSTVENVGRTFAGNNLLHIAAQTGNMFLFEALVRRGVEFDVRNNFGFTPLAFAIGFSRMAVVRFLITQYRERGRAAQDVLRDLIDRPPLSGDGEPLPLTVQVINWSHNDTISDEDKRAMLEFLVQEAGANIWTPAPATISWEGIDRKHTILPLHAAAHEANRPVLQFLLTECGMPVDSSTSDLQETALHFLVTSKRTEAEVLSIATWMVEEKGADVLCLNREGNTAAEIAYLSSKPRMYSYLRRQEKQQAARTAKEKKKEEEEKRKAAESATMARRMQEAEEGMAAWLLELEAEEAADKQAAAAAAGNKKKKASGGGKEKKK